MQQQLKILILIVFAGILGFNKVMACGLITHQEIVHRGTYYFNGELFPLYHEMIRKHADALEAGATFPDWGYSFGYHDESEDAHWDPFVVQAAKYIHENYPKPWDEETEKLAVFLLGIEAHNIADQSFHGLDSNDTILLQYHDEGFLRAMGHQEFHHNWEDAHSLGDFGGDVVVAHDYDLSWLSKTWYVPATDMAAVYHQLGYENVTPEILKFYNLLLFVGAHAERIAVGLFYPMIVKQSPFLAEEFQDYAMGGLDDMAIWSSFRWEDVISWMENGVVEAELPELRTMDHHPINREHQATLEDGLNKLKAAGYGVDVTKTKSGVRFSLSVLEKKTGNTDEASILDKQTHGTRTSGNLSGIISDPEELTDLTVTIDGLHAYEYAGTALAAGDFNDDGIDELVIGAPGYSEPGMPHCGRVYIIRGQRHLEANDTIDLNSVNILTGETTFARFGWASTVCDLNTDGIDDLAVSAPTVNADTLDYHGRVYIYYGSNDGVSDTPDITITTDELHFQLGWTLTGDDIDSDGFNDLIIGSPRAWTIRGGSTLKQNGQVAIFRSSTGHASFTDVKNADFLLTGATPYDWFGHHIAIADNLLLVGAPTAYGKDGAQSSGRIYAYDQSNLNGEPVFSISGASEFYKTAQYFACGDPFGDGNTYLALASPSGKTGLIEQTGSVKLFKLSDLKGDLYLSDLESFATFRGISSLGRFGWRVMFADFDNDGVDDLFITEPWHDTITRVNTGACHVWLGGNSFPFGTLFGVSFAGDYGLSIFEKRSLFGSCIVKGNFNGDNAMDVAISARNVSTENRLSGTVELMLSPYGEYFSEAVYTAPAVFEKNSNTIPDTLKSSTAIQANDSASNCFIISIMN